MATEHPMEATVDAAATPETGLRPEEEPVVTGTLFFMLILLMLLFGFWGLMYVTLLNR